VAGPAVPRGTGRRRAMGAVAPVVETGRLTGYHEARRGLEELT